MKKDVRFYNEPLKDSPITAENLRMDSKPAITENFDMTHCETKRSDYFHRNNNEYTYPTIFGVQSGTYY